MGSKAIIYLIDDDAAVRDALVTYLEIWDYSVDAFESSEAFLEKVDEKSQGVLVLDIRLPGLSGIELQTVLRKRRIDIPVIFITGHGDEKTIEMATQEGAVDCLEKPFDHSALLKRIEAALIRNMN
jgi:FixJ family two-component response regulator